MTRCVSAQPSQFGVFVGDALEPGIEPEREHPNRIARPHLALAVRLTTLDFGVGQMLRASGRG
jgi:hypothetical protein